VAKSQIPATNFVFYIKQNILILFNGNSDEFKGHTVINAGGGIVPLKGTLNFKSRWNNRSAR
jgi:hypothetical protein